MQTFLFPSPEAFARISQIRGRSMDFGQEEYQSVLRILEDVRQNGDSAVVKYANRFDSPSLTPSAIQVSEAELASAVKEVDAAFLETLARAIDQIRDFHARQVSQSWISTPRPGTLLGQLVRPVDAAGIYVPGARGGETPLVSSVLMGGIPAKIAGVKKIAMATPASAEGRVSPYLLAAARMVGVDDIFKVGSAWAIAALAYGTPTIPKVDVIVGPGNIYVTLAKKIVAGSVGIDMIAGPSEILVIADDTADPEFIAADLLSQAEHDPMASSVLITTSEDTAQKTSQAIERQLPALSRQETARQSLARFGAAFVVESLAVALDLANDIAPEHLELLVSDPFELIGDIRNAGAVFLGPHTPEPVGDYFAGPNHVLPTAGTARFASALSVEHFTKKTSLIHYSRSAFQKEADDIMRLARIEGLDAHANAIKVRR